MTSSLHERVAAAIELASRATPEPWLVGCANDSVMADYGIHAGGNEYVIADMCNDADEPQQDNAEFIAASHAHVALIKELYAALLASEEARVLAEVDAARWRWARNKLEIRMQRMMAGPDKPCLNVRIGRYLVNDSHMIFSVNPERDEKRRVEMEATIDAAMKVTP